MLIKSTNNTLNLIKLYRYTYFSPNYKIKLLFLKKIKDVK